MLIAIAAIVSADKCNYIITMSGSYIDTNVGRNKDGSILIAAIGRPHSVVNLYSSN